MRGMQIRDSDHFAYILCICVYVYVYIYIHVYTYIYIHQLRASDLLLQL